MRFTIRYVFAVGLVIVTVLLIILWMKFESIRSVQEDIQMQSFLGGVNVDSNHGTQEEIECRKELDTMQQLYKKRQVMAAVHNEEAYLHIDTDYVMSWYARCQNHIQFPDVTS